VTVLAASILVSRYSQPSSVRKASYLGALNPSGHRSHPWPPDIQKSDSDWQYVQSCQSSATFVNRSAPAGLIGTVNLTFLLLAVRMTGLVRTGTFVEVFGITNCRGSEQIIQLTVSFTERG
jgi:hypothetical protein